MIEWKRQIEDKLNAMDLEKAKEFIQIYEKIHPADMDLLMYKTVYYIYAGDLNAALNYALEGKRCYPTNGDMYYNLATVYEMQGEYISACINYVKADAIYNYTGDARQGELQIESKVQMLFQQYQDAHKKNVDNDADYFLSCIHMLYGFMGKDYIDKQIKIGEYYWVNKNEKRYVGMQKFKIPEYVGESNWNLMQNRGELLVVEEGHEYQVPCKNDEYLLPIATDERGNVLSFQQDGREYEILQKMEKHFNYYRVRGNTKVNTKNICYFGNPIPLGHDKKRKKIVLNIFVDGLSQLILDGDEFEKIMPFTYRFFQKGTICTKAYSSAEWTYPSLANIVTGLDTLHHRMFHNELEVPLPEEIPTLAEYFHDAGYLTTKMDGDWRSIPTVGHARGYDRVLYHCQILGSKEEEMVGNVIEQLEAFQDTDHFMWFCMGDLHDVADGYDLPVGIQAKMDLENRVMDDKGISSVKQNSSIHKTENYKKMATYTDVLLNALYQYILEKYEEDEFIVSLFADHGQGYLIPENGPFLGKERTNIAFMFRGGAPEQVTDEVISSSDYVSIMTHLAGITMRDVPTMGNLPLCFGGDREREYALSESLHPHDLYYATIYTKDMTVYFENGMPVGDDGRFELKDYRIWGTDMLGKLIGDEALLKPYLDIILERIAPFLIYR